MHKLSRSSQRAICTAVTSFTAALLLVALPGRADDEIDPPDLPIGLAPATRPAEPEGPEGLDDEPELPEGLDDGPELPKGLDDDEPDLPAGMGEPPAPSLAKRLGLAGFWEVRGGIRTRHDPYEKDASLAESRLQLEWEKTRRDLTFKLTADLLYDAAGDHHRVNLETGHGLLDLREASVMFSPLKSVDVKLGRQILTWGTGDLLFLNDLFPKDWPAFLAGRDVEYLKAPSDAVKVSTYSNLVNLDVVYTPRFDADRFIRGERVSFFNAALGRQSGRDAIVRADRPDRCFGDHELAWRLFRNVKGYELAGYGYYGFWKSPAGRDPVTGKATFPDLAAYGASLRGPVRRGIGNVEFAYYDSRNDRSGANPMVRNSEARLLVGYKQDLPEVARDLTVGGQYSLEWMMDHADYRRTLPPGAKAAAEARHVATARVTKLMMNQNLMLSLFAFYSPSDNDAHLRPNAQYKIDDHWTVEFGANVFFGADNRTFFGQFDNNSSIYASLRYGF